MDNIKKKILIIRFRQIGDSILSAPLCKTLKKTFPNSQIDYVVYDHIAPLFKNYSYIDNVITINSKERKNIFLYLKKVYNTVKNKYDIIIDIMSTPKSELFTLLAPKCEYKIGRYKKRNFSYTHRIKEKNKIAKKTEKFLWLLDPLKEKYNIVYDEDFSIEISINEKNYMKERMINSNINFNLPIVAFGINTRVPEKIYNIDKMKEIIKFFLENTNSQILFYYSPQEKDFALSVHKDFNFNKRIISSLETKNIKELAMVFSNCDLFFGNEGGPRHLAHAVGIPTFTIYRPNFDRYEWGFEDELHVGISPNDIDSNAYSYPTEKQWDVLDPYFIGKELIKFFNKIIKEKQL